jgi:hypothetical protein
MELLVDSNLSNKWDLANDQYHFNSLNSSI